jgi:hypothetical protein
MAGQINTGTGGIDIDGDLYGMDVGVPDSQGGKQGKWSGGDVAVDDSDKDISKPTKETFAKYMSKTTLGKAGSSQHSNRYPVGEGDATTVEDLKLVDSVGYPTRPAETTNPFKFSSVGIGVPLVDPKTFKKGLGEPSIPDGNSLLINAAVPADSGGPYVKPSKGLNEPMEKYVSQVLTKNRFSSEKRFSGGGSLQEEDFNTNTTLYVSKDLQMGVSPSEQEKKPEEYNYRRLAQVGTVLQMAATGEFAAIQGNSIDPNDFGVAASTLIPGLGQIGAGAPLPAEYLNVEEILNKLAGNGVNDAQLVDFSSKYEGVINSSFEKFSGFSAVGMTALVVALGIAIITAFSVFGQIFSADSANTRVPSPREVSKHFMQRLGLGTFYGIKVTDFPEDLAGLIATVGSGNALQFFGILPTMNDFGTAVRIGVTTTFGLNDSFAPVSTFSSSGFLVTISRSIVRSVTNLFLQFEDFINLISSAVTSGGGGGDALAKGLEIISTIKNSRFIRCFNVFAQIGDKMLDRNVLLSDVTLNIDGGKKISLIDTLPQRLKGPSDYGKSRLYAEGNKTNVKLAWASDRSPSMLLMPPNHLEVSKHSLLNSPILSKVGDDFSRTRYASFDSSNFRISPEAVRQIENTFEAEYMPFYFQDLRTNEFLGFHAFLTQLTDEYTSNYDSVDGIGRMDPVKVYKNTTRRLGVSFVVAALDPKDFDTMHEKINRLTMMAYPQYTKGKKLSINNGDYVIEKPFTQMISASPMIRLRVGDLFRSNYSKFNIAGIFGLMDDDAIVNKINTKGETASGSSSSASDPSSNSAGTAQQQPPAQPATTPSNNVQSTSVQESKSSKASLEESDEVYKIMLNNGITAQGFDIPIAVGDVFLLSSGEYTVQTETSLEKINTEKYPNAFAVKILSISPTLPTLYSIFSKDVGDSSDILNASSTGAEAYVDNTTESFGKFFYTVEIQQPNPAEFDSLVGGAWNIVNDITKYKDNYRPILSSLGFKSEIPNVYGKQTVIVGSNLGVPSEATLKRLDVSPQATSQSAPAGEQKSSTAKKSAYRQEVVKFLDEKNNAITRSFKSVSGKGIAGFIESISLDWNSGTWETDPGKRAPKVCKITIGFAPIHDISPGLDAYGFNRAPIYPLGPYRRRGS